MKKFSSILSLILISFIALSAQNNERQIWKIYAVADASNINSETIRWSGKSSFRTTAVLEDDTFNIKDFNTFFISMPTKEVRGFARRKIYTFKDEYGQTGTLVFQTDPTNMDDDKRYLILILFDDTEKGRIFIAEKPETIQTNYQTIVGNEANIEDAVPFVMVEEKPAFMGGDASQFSQWVNQRLIYPEDAKESGIQGRVTTEFTVGSDGNVYNIKILHGVFPSLDAEAVRVISMSPKWRPGRVKDEAVPVIYTFPVIFKLR